MSSIRSARTKNCAYVVTEVDRATRCILGWDVVGERTREGRQDLVERSPQASQYDSAAFPTYDWLVYYPGKHAVAPGKRQTYAVEADNAALRHYLARLARRSRCFSRSIAALRRAVKLFVYACNRRQLHRRTYPTYECHVMDFVCPQF